MIRAHEIVRGRPGVTSRRRTWRLDQWITRSLGGPVSRAGFEYVKLMMVRDWDFLYRSARILPMFAGIVVVLATAASPFDRGFSGIHIIPHLIGLVLRFLSVFSVYGSAHRAIWIFQTLPATAFRKFTAGVHLSFWMPFVGMPHLIALPIHAWSWGIWEAAAFAAYSGAIASLYLAWDMRNTGGIPFTKEFGEGTGLDPDGIASLVVRLILAAAAIGVQYFLLFRSRAIVSAAWLRLKFKLSMLQSSTGLVRFYVRRLRPHIEFYASPMNFDAESPIFPVSAPPDYGKELAAKIGLFGTLAMAEDHGGLNNGRFDEDAYLEQCHLVLKERERMMFYELDRFQEGVLFVVFDTPDRVQHMFWRFRDPEHPCFDPSRAALGGRLDSIDEHYLWVDALLRRVLERVDENTLLVVLSDHGFGAFRRAFHVI